MEGSLAGSVLFFSAANQSVFHVPQFLTWMSIYQLKMAIVYTDGVMLPTLNFYSSVEVC